MEETLIKRVMPNSLEAEQSVIGSMIMDQDAIVTAMEILLQEDFYHKQYGILFDAMPEYDVSMYANKKQKTTPETAKEALEALLPVLSDEALDFGNRDAVFDACKAKAEELGKKNGWLLYPLGIALSGKQRTPGGGTDLACMMGRETTLARVKAAIEKLNG